MTNHVAIALALVIAGAMAADWLLNGGAGMLFLGRKLLAFIEWLAFWR